MDLAVSISGIQVLLRSARIPFLALGPICVLLGVGTALHAGIQPVPLQVALVLLGAVAAHVSVNAFNEYLDFHSGLDALTVKTPFSGGSGALPEHPQSARSVLHLAVAALGVTVLVGLYFTWLRGLLILPVGVAGILIILLYTRWLTLHPWLCLVAPGAGFGLLMVAGTHLALTGMYSPFSLYVALVPFFLTNNLLLLNQLPDIGPDRNAGRRHFPIVYGVPATAVLHCLFTVAAALTIVAGVQTGAFPPSAWLSLIPLGAAVVACAGTLRSGQPPVALMPLLGLNVLASLATPLVLGVALLDG